MADEFNTTSNWWDSSSRYSTGSSSSSSSSSAAAAAASSSYIGWPITAAYHNNHHQNQMMDIKSVARSSLDSPASVSSGSSVDHLHMMGLALDWNQTALLRGGEKSDQGSFRSTLQQDSNNNLNSTSGYRGFSLDQFSPHGNCSSDSSSVTCCQGLPSSCFSPLDSSSATNLYGNNNSNNNAIYQVAGMLGSENQNYHYAAAAGAAVSSSYGMNANTTELLPSWSAAATNNKVPQFLRNSANSSSPPKPPPQHLQFSNNAPFWNASAGGINDVRSPNFFPTLQAPYAATQCAYDEIKPNNRHHHASDHQGVRNTAAKKSSSSGSEQQPTSKRAKNDQTTSSLPAFKVRKEKMGDRITALQQLVSPFGKTDTASVLSEAIEYIKFLHEQVAVLSTPYMKSGVPIPHQQNLEKGKESEGEKQDLRSRGLCLVPVSSTFPVTQETTVDFWTPTFGGTFR